MAANLPLRLLRCTNGEFDVFDPRPNGVPYYDIVSYTWGEEVDPYESSISGVDWKLTIHPQKVHAIKKLMVTSDTTYLWCDCVCLNQLATDEKAAEISKMFDYYKSARRCHVLLEMPQVWIPQEIVDNLKFIDHVVSHMEGTALASEARLTTNLINRLSWWAEQAPWVFPIDKAIVRSAAVDMGVLNCYATCVSNVKALFENAYFTRVWTFQEMILGKNITMWTINPRTPDYAKEQKLENDGKLRQNQAMVNLGSTNGQRFDHDTTATDGKETHPVDVNHIGQLEIWMDLATDSTDKAHKLLDWIDGCRYLNTASVNAILMVIEYHKIQLKALKLQVRGISGARSDIINGGSQWWVDNEKGVLNIFSAISLTPRQCGREKVDLYRGLLGIFSGLFTDEEMKRDLSGTDLNTVSVNFFKQLSHRTGIAWANLAISSQDSEEYGWLPKVETHDNVSTTDCFAGVVRLGRLKPKGHAKTLAMTNIKGAPKKYMDIRLFQSDKTFEFVFKGCNCGKSVKTGVFSKEPISTNDRFVDVAKDDTGRVLVQCATILAAIFDPDTDWVAYRKRLLEKFRPQWTVSDPSAKPLAWVDRCVSGTSWEMPESTRAWDQSCLRVHNQSMSYRLVDVDVASCGSRLANDSTASISCEVRVSCGCIIVAPLPFIFEAIPAIEGSFLGEEYTKIDNDDRIILNDGVGIVQPGDVGKTFSLVAFSGDTNAHRTYAASCRSTKVNKAVPLGLNVRWPSSRALVRGNFTHGMMRDYGYVPTYGAGNLLICRNHVMDDYRIIGVCVDENIYHEKETEVHIR